MRTFRPQEIIDIRRQAVSGRSVRDLARKFSSSPATIHKIITGQTYADVGGPIASVGERSVFRRQVGCQNPNAQLDALQVIEIRNQLRGEVPRQVLAERFAVSCSTIDKLAKWDTWQEPYLFGNGSHDFPDPELLTIELRDANPVRGSDAEDRLVGRVVAAYREYGFPYRRWRSDQFTGYLARICQSEAHFSSEGIVSGGASGLRLLNAFHPSIEHVARKGCISPADVFQDDMLFKKAVREQIRYGARLTPFGIRSALGELSGSSQISSFRPSIALALIKHFKAKRVLDPCAGWGGRMVGALAAGIDYVGIDPNEAAITGNTAFLNELRRVSAVETKVDLLQCCAEDVLASDLDLGSFDLVLTSPPYFDLERYSHDPTQSYLRYSTLEDWSRYFVAAMLDGAKNRLSVGGHLALNVSDTLADVITDAAKSVGLERIEVYRISFNTRRWCRQVRQVRHEPILIFRRRDE